MDEEVKGGIQQYCQHCGAPLRTDTAFCISCGKSLVSDPSQNTGNSRAASKKANVSDPMQKVADGQGITAYILAAVIVLIAIYLFVSYSVFAGGILVVLAVVAIGWVRQTRGNQTEFEKRIFEKLPEYRQSIRSASVQVGSQYREWNQARTIRLEEEATARAREQAFSERRVELERYRTFFRRAYAGSDYFLNWWRAYADKESEETSRVPTHLNTLQERSEAGLQKTQEAETALNQYSGTEEFAGQANLHLNNLKVSQENFGGSETVFTPMVAAHNSVKDKDGWARFQEEFERFVKDLEDLLDSPVVKTEAANRVRFPNPAEHRETRRVHCSTCGRENIPEANYCLGCGTSIGNSVRDSFPTTSNSGTTFVLLSIPFAIISLFLLPPLFGGIGIFLGYKANQTGNGAGGVAMMVVSTACLLFGMLSGFLYWGF